MSNRPASTSAVNGSNTARHARGSQHYLSGAGGVGWNTSRLDPDPLHDRLDGLFDDHHSHHHRTILRRAPAPRMRPAGTVRSTTPGSAFLASRLHPLDGGTPETTHRRHTPPGRQVSNDGRHIRRTSLHSRSPAVPRSTVPGTPLRALKPPTCSPWRPAAVPPLRPPRRPPSTPRSAEPAGSLQWWLSTR